MKNLNPNDNDKLTIIPLGAGLEVGRSCIVLNYKGKNIMFDCGVHMKFSGQQSLPYFDLIDPSKIDLLLVTHFHLDHCGAVPYFLEHTDFKGRVYMTYPTKAIYKLVISDSAKVSNPRGENFLFDKKDLNNSMSKIHMIDYHQELEYKGIKFTCYNAGHVIGAAMFMVEIEGVRVLYTGDYSREEDRHLNPAEIPNCTVDILIVESTYGIKTHEPRQKRELRFTKEVHDIIKRGGKCLLPVFALGRAQELLLILEEYWKSHPELEEVPILYPCALAAKSMIIFQTYFNMMGTNVQAKFKNGKNPFDFDFIQTLQKLEKIETLEDPCVIMTSPGMLQNGLSREIFEKWCHDERNGVVQTGYCVKGTLAEIIMNHPKKITTMDNCQADLNMSISSISFSAHADYSQTSDFIGKVKPKHVILVHGEKNECFRLHEQLQKDFPNITILKPENQQKVHFTFESNKKCKIVGELANELEEEISSFQFTIPKNSNNEEEEKVFEKSIPIKDGILVIENSNILMMKEKDLPKFTEVLPIEINQKLFVPFVGTLSLVRSFALQLFNNNVQVKEYVEFGVKRKYIVILNEIYVKKQESKNMLIFEWISSKKNDIAADHFSFLLSQFPEDPEFDLFNEDNKIKTYDRLIDLIFMNFVNSKLDKSRNIIEIINGPFTATLNLNNYAIESNNEELQKRIEILLDNVVQSNMPLY